MQDYKKSRVPSFKTSMSSLTSHSNSGLFFEKKKMLFSYTKIFYYILVPEQVSMELIFLMTPNGLHLTQWMKNQNTFYGGGYG